MITGDDSRHRAEMAKPDPQPSGQLLRVPCRIKANGREIEGEAVIDTGASHSCIHGDFDNSGETDQGVCYCGQVITAPHADAVLIVAGVEITNPLLFPPDPMGSIALIGLDVLMQCRFVYGGGKFTLEKI